MFPLVVPCRLLRAVASPVRVLAGTVCAPALLCRASVHGSTLARTPSGTAGTTELDAAARKFDYDRFESCGGNTLHEGKWLRFMLRNYTDRKHPGVVRTHEMVKRVTTSPPDAVIIVPTIKRKGHPDELMLIMSWRPPVARACLEFPAGLIDQGEDVRTAALRELREETGYVGRVTTVSRM